MANVSIIVNCYNSDEYLEEALQTLVDQTYTDFEVVFIDNCSEDRSAAIAKSFMNKDKLGDRLKYYKTDYTIPLGAGRNFALERCEGNFIAFLDCDDLWEKDKLEVQIPLMEENSRCCMLTANFYELNMISKEKKPGLKEKPQGMLPYESFAVNYEYAMSSFMIRKSFMDLMDYRFDERLSYAEEYDFFLRLACYGDIYYSPAVLSSYRVHEQMNSRKLRENVPTEYNIVLQNLKKCCDGLGLNKADIYEYLAFLRDYTKTKLLINKADNASARVLIKPYAKKYKKALAYYLLTFLPKAISQGMVGSYYKDRTV